MYKPSIAIACMIREPSPSITTWIEYHLKQVDRIYFYLDQHRPGDEQLLTGIPGVRVLPGERAGNLQGADHFIDRQNIVVANAIEQCRREGIDWLIHIDSDELIWSPGRFLRDYFAGLEADVSSVVFTNHEVVPQFEDIKDCFRELQLFKRNPACLQGAWVAKGHDQFFHAYTNGKAAVRIREAEGPFGPHDFMIRSGRKHNEHTSVSVLHYCSPTYGEWLKKYAQLGDFSDFWHEDPNSPIMLRFHLNSRDAYLKARRELDWKITEDFYRSSLFSQGEMHQMLNTGAVFWVDPLADLERLGPERPAASACSPDSNSRQQAPMAAETDGRRFAGRAVSGIAIVSTISGPDVAFKTWLDCHLKQVDRLFLYVDEPQRSEWESVAALPGVTVSPGHREGSLQGIPRMVKEQQANVVHALERCRREGIEWLIHLDGDELIWPAAMTLKRCLEQLPGDAVRFTLMNHEALGRVDDVTDCFRELNLFKRNGCVRESAWVAEKYGQFFAGYSGGKAAIRVAHAREWTGQQDVEPKDGGMLEAGHGVAVLHYPFISYTQWLQKFKMLGDFSNYWLDDRNFPNRNLFYLRSRDVVLHARRRLDWKIAEDHYRSTLLHADDVARLLNTGTVFWANPLHDISRFDYRSMKAPAVLVA